MNETDTCMVTYLSHWDWIPRMRTLAFIIEKGLVEALTTMSCKRSSDLAMLRQLGLSDCRIFCTPFHHQGNVCSKARRGAKGGSFPRSSSIFRTRYLPKVQVCKASPNMIYNKDVSNYIVLDDEVCLIPLIDFGDLSVGLTATPWSFIIACWLWYKKHNK